MAKQDPNPPAWRREMGDGCSGVPDYYYADACDAHDRAYHIGGTVEDKLIADGQLYWDMCNTKGFGGWLARRGLARIRYNGVRWTTFNYPPGHPQRAEGRYIEAFNWLGPGPSG